MDNKAKADKATAKPKNHDVQLSTTEEKPRKRTFPIKQANKLLKLKNTAWKLDDKGYSFNGNEIEPK